MDCTISTIVYKINPFIWAANEIALLALKKRNRSAPSTG